LVFGLTTSNFRVISGKKAGSSLRAGWQVMEDIELFG
jgi:hypothetical protein